MLGFRWQPCSDVAAVTYHVVLQFSCAVTRYRRELKSGQIGKIIVYKLTCWCDINKKMGHEMNLRMQDKTHIQVSVSFGLWS